MKIISFSNYYKLNETINDNPEQYIKTVLLQIKAKLEAMFQDESTEGEVKKFSKEDESEEMNFAELGLELQSLELSRYSKTMDNIKLKFSDEEFLYDLLIGIDIKEAVPKNDKQFKLEDIKTCFIKFKKYDLHEPGEVLGELTDNIKIKDIDEDLLVSLKLKLDEQSGEGETEEFEIETD